MLKIIIFKNTKILTKKDNIFIFISHGYILNSLSDFVEFFLNSKLRDGNPFVVFQIFVGLQKHDFCTFDQVPLVYFKMKNATDIVNSV